MQIKTILGYTEEVLIAGCCKGDRKCYEALYLGYSKKMLGVCMRYVNNQMEAEDIVQDGFIKVFKNIDKYRGDGSFEGWLRRIFVNTAIEHYRKQAKMYMVIELEHCHAELVEESAVSHLQKEDLLEMVHSLSLGYRTVFNLYAIEGYSHKEISVLLGINEGTSKSQLARARVLLQKMVEQAAMPKIKEKST
jgi:RNA polymerase sigma-70 factor (ECF subfamily)